MDKILIKLVYFMDFKIHFNRDTFSSNKLKKMYCAKSYSEYTMYMRLKAQKYHLVFDNLHGTSAHHLQTKTHNKFYTICKLETFKAN